ncbi:MAG: AraC family transcriptional regulator [Gammaproteobacteria bacterium]|nr:AraC family transcriptional regulator [Gammaproteobacteria bacterium]
MQDRLVWLLEHFELRANVFQAGPLDCGEAFPALPGQGVIHVLQSGQVRIRNRTRKSLLVTEPSVILYLNPTTHRLEPADDGVTMVCASFSFGLGEGNPLQEALPDMYLLPLAEAPTLADTMRQLFFEATEEHCGRQAVLNRLVEVGLILILRDLMDQNRLNVGLLAGLADPKLLKAINAMHADPARPWTLAQLAKAAGMSRARFADHFRTVVGMTPGAYLSEWRLGVAQALLLRARPVKLVAADVGYGSPSALSRAFTARLGMSPSAWLRSRQGESSGAH